ncbi:MAG: hypothetical protein AAFY71_13105 [Bacteroidota bacterium]
MKWFVCLCGMMVLLGGKAFGQQLPDSLVNKESKHLQLPFEADRIHVDAEGNIFLLNTGERQIYKMLALYNYDSLISIGGASAREESLLHPIDIQSQNRQRVYVLDDVSRRLILLNINLKVLQSFEFVSEEVDIEEEEVFPIAFTLSPAGELFVLNQWTNTILRFSNQLNPNGEFGGTDFGQGSLFDPKAIEMDERQDIYVLDRKLQKILIYSFYGVYQYAIDLPPFWTSDKFQVQDNYILSAEGSSFNLYHIPTRGFHQYPMDALPEILDFSSTREHFYFLTRKGIFIYQRSS